MSKLTNNKLPIFASVNHKAHKMDQNLAFNLQKWPFWAAEEDPEPWGQLGRLTEAKNVNG